MHGICAIATMQAPMKKDRRSGPFSLGLGEGYIASSPLPVLDAWLMVTPPFVVSA